VSVWARPFSHSCPWLQEVLAQKHGLQNDNQELQDKYNQKAMWVLLAGLPACATSAGRCLPEAGAGCSWWLVAGPCILLEKCPCGCCTNLVAAASEQCQPLSRSLPAAPALPGVPFAAFLSSFLSSFLPARLLQAGQEAEGDLCAAAARE
jgi:hypothetical protein